MLLGPGRRPLAMTTLAAALLGASAGAPSSALAQTGGASAAPLTPSIASVTCRGGCADHRTVQPGGIVTLRGSDLDRVSAVVFLGGRGTRDDVRVRVRAKSPLRLDVHVPTRAHSGQVAAIAASGVASRASAVSIRVVKRATGTPLMSVAPGPALSPVRGIAQLDAGLTTRTLGTGASAATVTYLSYASLPVTIRLDVVRLADGLSVFSDERAAAPGEPERVAWNGRVDGGTAVDGRYEVRLTAVPDSAPRAVPLSAGLAAGGAAPQGSPAPPGSARIGVFTFLSAVFPVRGTHDYGGSAARFGAGRSGHRHEGQDVMAACGTPVVAARGGMVKQKAFHSAAGNYVVISDPVTGEDQMYAHFRAPALVDRGDRVETGQQIGVVGDTGDASACHLHFELWTAPGWYEGGSPLDPLPTLKRWDRVG